MKVPKLKEINGISERNVPYSSNIALHDENVLKVTTESKKRITDPKSKSCVTKGHDHRQNVLIYKYL